MATTRGKRLRRLTTSAMKPVSGSLTPVPKRASTRMSVRSGSRRDCSRSDQSPSSTIHSMGTPIFRATSRLAPASPFKDSGRAISTTCVATPPRWSCRATTRPSPPLFPLPQTTSTLEPCRPPKCRSISRTTPLPAFSMSNRLGRPYRDVVSRSTQLNLTT